MEVEEEDATLAEDAETAVQTIVVDAVMVDLHAVLEAKEEITEDSERTSL